MSRAEPARRAAKVEGADRHIRGSGRRALTAVSARLHSASHCFRLPRLSAAKASSVMARWSQRSSLRMSAVGIAAGERGHRPCRNRNRRCQSTRGGGGWAKWAPISHG